MRIALSGWFWNQLATGSGQYLHYLVEQLLKLFPESEFILIAPPDRLSGQVAWADLRAHPLPAPPGPGGKVWWEQVLLPRAACVVQADLLHVPYWAPPWWNPRPTLVTVHDLIPLLLPAYRGGLLGHLYTALVRAASARGAYLLTDSECSRRDILQQLRVRPAEVQAIPLAVGGDYGPAPHPDDESIRRKLGVKPGYLLYLGGFDRRKNLQAVFNAFVGVYRRLGAEARLVVAGRLPAADTAFTPDPRRLWRESGIPEGAVRFTGFVAETDKAALYRGARVFLFPSYYEGFGLPPLEALTCGIPVVGSNAASLPAVVGAGGSLVSPTDVEGLTEAVLRLFTDEACYRQKRQAALQQAARFSWEQTATETFAVYQKLVR
ncbi:MAG TPA: glycosyltransferase family 4 protein [Thermoflexia bacterium]|nr:glycosyltransferase family 4 protein [Thermoflexia bacterium]